MEKQSIYSEYFAYVFVLLPAVMQIPKQSKNIFTIKL